MHLIVNLLPYCRITINYAGHALFYYYIFIALIMIDVQMHSGGNSELNSVAMIF